MKEVNLHIFFTCSMYRQEQCKGYGKGPTHCVWGLPDRPCYNVDLQREAIKEYLPKIGLLMQED